MIILICLKKAFEINYLIRNQNVYILEKLLQNQK